MILLHAGSHAGLAIILIVLGGSVCVFFGAFLYGFLIQRESEEHDYLE